MRQNARSAGSAPKRMLDIWNGSASAKRRGSIWRNSNDWQCKSARAVCAAWAKPPNPVLTTLKYFRDEYEAHLQGRCPAKKMHRTHQAFHQPGLHRLHDLRAALSGGRDSDDAVCAPCD